MKKILLMICSIFILVGCGIDFESNQSAQEKATKDNGKAIENIVKNDNLPIIERSLERENLKRRIEFINQPNRTGYLYLLSNNGQLIKEVQVIGKVSSLNSYLTPMDEPYGSVSTGYTTIQSADIDGTWGENDNGIFWFTPDGVYQEWTGLYLYSSERMSFDVKPVLMEVMENE